MMIILFASITIIILWIILLAAVSIYNNFQTLLIRINEAETNIDSILRKRFDLLNKSIDVIKNHIKTDKEVLNDIIKLKSRKISNYDLDRQLYNIINEFNNYKEKYPDLNKNENFMKIDIALTESEAEITAFRKYYNDIITEYNKLAKTFPSNLIAFIFSFKTKLYYDGKDMSDNDKNDFKL